MKLKNNYVLREVAGVWVVLPIGEATANFNGMLTLNESGALLWKALERGDDRMALVDVITKEYAVERSRALNDVNEFLETLMNAGCLDI